MSDPVKTLLLKVRKSGTFAGNVSAKLMAEAVNSLDGWSQTRSSWRNVSRVGNLIFFMMRR